MARFSWRKPPPVMVLSGTEGFYVRRNLQRALKGAAQVGRQVESLDSDKVEEGLNETLSLSGLMPNPVLLVVREAAKVPVESFYSHVQSGDNTVSLLLVCEGVTTPSKYKDVLPKGSIFEADAPAKPHEVTRAAERFLVRELKGLGRILSEELAQSWVSLSGTDLGVLWFEILKVDTYMKACGLVESGVEVKPKHIKAVLFAMRDVTPEIVVNAVGEASEIKIFRAMRQLRTNSKDDPTMGCAIWLGNQVTRWLHVALLDAQGASTQEGASRLGLNPYVYERMLLPVSKRWGVPKLFLLLQGISDVQKAVVEGTVQPWSLLQSLVVGLSKEVRKKRVY